MHWLFPSVVATLSSTLIFCFVYFYLYKSEKELAFGIWSISWLIYSLRFVCMLIILKFGQASVLLIGNQLFSLVSVVALVWGTLVWLNKPFSKYWLIISALLAAWIIYAVITDLSFMVLTLPTFIFLGGIYIWVGIVFIRNIRFFTLGKYITGWAFILWGVHKIDYPFLRPLEWFAPWGYLMASAFTAFAALGIVLLYFEKTKLELSNSEERYRQLAENINEVFWIVSTDWKNIYYISPAYESVWGKPCDSLYKAPESWIDSIIDEDKQEIIDYIQKVTAVDVSDIVFPEYRIQRPDGSQRWIFARGFPIKDNKNRTIKIVGLAEDVTKRKQAEESLRDSEDKFRSIAEQLPDLIALTDKAGVITYASPSTITMFRMNPDEMVGTHFSEYLTEASLPAAMKAFDSGTPTKDLNLTITRNDGTTFFGELSGIHRDKETLVTIKDITDRRESAKKLQKGEQLLREVINSMEKAIAIYEPVEDGEDFRFEDINEFAEKIMHYKQEDVLGKTIKELFPGEPSVGLIEKLKETYLTGKSTTIPLKQYQDDRITQWVENYIFKLPSGMVVAMFEDTSEKRRMEEQIKASLKEKETLLYEIHHRVKNNMQIIASLLKLQLNQKDKQDVDAILRENMGRVYSMAAIHESLHQSEKLSEIDIKAYTQKLSQMLSRTYSVDPGKVTFQIDTPELKLAIDKANPLGLVLNELISNSLKYAFPDDQKGTINIKSRFLEKETIELVVADNGIGIPDSFDWENSESLGLKLIKSLVENQLDGSIDLDSTNGTRFTIKINLESNYKS